MNIIIAGAGTVGKSLAGQLCDKEHDVTVIDLSKGKLKQLDELYDLDVRHGDSTDVSLLKSIMKSRAEKGKLLSGEQKKKWSSKIDLVIAVTVNDSVNIMTCHLAHSLGASHCIARIRRSGVFDDHATLSPEQMGIETVIYPEAKAAEEVHNLLLHPYADQVFDFLKRFDDSSRIQVVGVTVEKNNTALMETPMEGIPRLSARPFRIAGIQRGEDAFIPTQAKKTLHAGDRIFVVAESKDLRQVVRDLGFSLRSLKKVFIYGGSNIGYSVARRLESDTDILVSIIEPRRYRAKELAYDLHKTLVLHGEGTEAGLLEGEGVADADVFISVTDDENSNLLSCLLAKQLGVKKTIALVAKPDYVPLIAHLNVDSIVSQRLMTINAIMHFARAGEVVSSEELVEGKIQAMQFRVTGHTQVIGKVLKSEDFRKDFPEGALIGGIERRNDVAEVENGAPPREVMVAHGDTVLKPNDKVLVFCPSEVMESVEEFFAS